MAQLINWRNDMEYISWTDVASLAIFVIALAPFLYAIFGQRND